MRPVRTTSTPLITIARTPSTTSRMPIYTLTPRRSMHYQPFVPVFGRQSSYSPCAPRSQSLVPSLFRGLEDELASLDSLFNLAPSRPTIRPFQPRFDVREEADAFHLTGEVPGVDAADLTVEFADRNTLVVKGRSVRESQRGKKAPDAALQDGVAAQDKGKQKAAEGAENEAAAVGTGAGDAMETEPTTSRPATPASGSSNYHKVSVEDSREDGDDFVDVAAEDGAEAQIRQEAAATEASNGAENTNVAQQSAQQQQQQQQQPAKDDGHYWVSERSVGSFQRSFRFPGLVDQENVKANLKDGVLSVVVPKVKESGPRRIQVE